MPLITILSDWKTANNYFGSVAGKLYSSDADVKLIELARVADHNITEAAYILNACLPDFPDGTIHLVFVGLTVDPGKVVIGKMRQQYVITWEGTGLLSLLEGIEKELLFTSDQPEWLSGIINCCQKLLYKPDPEIWAQDIKPTKVLRRLEPVIHRNSIQGNIIHVDTYGNAVSNIRHELFEEIRKGREYEIYLQSNFNKITSISRHYEPGKVGELIALFNEKGWLEIAISQGNLAELLNIDTSSEIRIKFIMPGKTNFLG